MKNKNYKHSSNLPLSKYPFLNGMGSVLNLSGNSDSLDWILERSDGDAIRSDWEMVGDSLWDALDQAEIIYKDKHVHGKKGQR